ncbi:hypothetical protein [Streptomyces sp. NPDC002779]|uniref:hypothetical protein n=1 Tax=Streptomyces sp. NPDC002779 TaxID=3364664 RepID=UPI0036D11936
MSLFGRSAKSSRDYPTAGASATGDASRFRRSKTTGARQAGADAEDWEQADRKRDKQGTSTWRWK